MHKVVDGREPLLQAKADCAKGDAVGEGDIPEDEDGHRQEIGWLYYKHVYEGLYLRIPYICFGEDDYQKKWNFFMTFARGGGSTTRAPCGANKRT